MAAVSCGLVLEVQSLIHSCQGEMREEEGKKERQTYR